MNVIQKALIQAAGWDQVNRNPKCVFQIDEKSGKCQATDGSLINAKVDIAMLIGISARIRTEQINPLCAVLRGKLGDNCFNLFNLYFRVITLASLHGILSL